MTVYAEIDDGANNQLRLEVTDADGAVVDCAGFSYSEAIRRLSGLTVGATYFVQLAHTDPTHDNELRVCAYRTPSCLPVERVWMSTGQNWTIVRWSTEGAGSGEYEVVVGPRNFFDPATDPPLQRALVRDANAIVIWDLDPGESYDFYVRQVCGPGDTSAFRLPTQRTQQESAGAVDNDLRARAEIIGSAFNGCGLQPGSTRFATSGDGEVGACAAAGPDVWYELTFSAPRYTFELASANGTAADLALEAYDAFGERLACVNVGGAGEPETLTLSESEVPPINGRSRVLLRVIAADRAESDFLICGYRDAPGVLEPEGCALPAFASFDGAGAPGALVDVLTAEGQIVCAIENTAALGQVVVNAYGFPGSEIRRLGGDGPAYADRSVAVSVATQPTAPVLVRFYLSAADIAGLIAAGAFPADGQFGTEELLAVARVAQTSCSVDFPGGAAAVEFVGAGPYGDGAYYVDVRVSAFSEFFFSGIGDPLPTTTVSVGDVGGERVLGLAPNPAGAWVRVTLPQNSSAAGVHGVVLLDATGRVVRTAPVTPGADAVRLDVADVPAGVYVVRSEGGGQRGGLARLVVGE